jgi:hypothetical protein
MPYACWFIHPDLNKGRICTCWGENPSCPTQDRPGGAPVADVDPSPFLVRLYAPTGPDAQEPEQGGSVPILIQG